MTTVQDPITAQPGPFQRRISEPDTAPPSFVHGNLALDTRAAPADDPALLQLEASPTTTLITGDCETELAGLADESVALVVTSPPYADARKNTYGGIHPDKYVAWFLRKAEQLRRVLRPDGTFILNIKEKVVKCERHTYVIDLIKALREQKWLWTEDWIWAKTTSMPGRWPNRFRDSWEHLLQFNKQREFHMDQAAVMVPAKPSTLKRMQHLTAHDRVRHASATGSGFGRCHANWIGRDHVYPANVIHLAPECDNVGHSAVFPVSLPIFFVKLFTKPGDLVLDPFSGVGTTGVAARRLGRSYIGIDIMPKYTALARDRIEMIG